MINIFRFMCGCPVIAIPIIVALSMSVSANDKDAVKDSFVKKRKPCDVTTVDSAKDKIKISDCNEIDVSKETLNGNKIRAIASGVNNKTHISLDGADNSVVTKQSGKNNTVVIEQTGSGNNASVSQITETDMIPAPESNSVEVILIDDQFKKD